jgi:hypothetical protein
MNDTTTHVAPNSLLFICFCHRQDPINIEEKNTLPHHHLGSLEILDTLLARNGLSRTLPGACIRFSSLTTNRKPSTMPEAAIALNLTKPADVLSNLTPKRTLNRIISLQHCCQATQLLFGKITCSPGRVNLESLANLSGSVLTDTIQVCQRELNLLLVWYIYTHHSGHKRPRAVVNKKLVDRCMPAANPDFHTRSSTG